MRVKIVKLAKKLKVNIQVVSIDTLIRGVRVELEHGRVGKKTNITDNDLETTLKIALAHLDEFPDYYDRLERLEKKAKEYWGRRAKPSIWE